MQALKYLYAIAFMAVAARAVATPEIVKIRDLEERQGGTSARECLEEPFRRRYADSKSPKFPGGY